MGVMGMLPNLLIVMSFAPRGKCVIRAVDRGAASNVTINGGVENLEAIASMTPSVTPLETEETRIEDADVEDMDVKEKPGVDVKQMKAEKKELKRKNRELELQVSDLTKQLGEQKQTQDDLRTDIKDLTQALRALTQRQDRDAREKAASAAPAPAVAPAPATAPAPDASPKCGLDMFRNLSSNATYKDARELYVRQCESGPAGHPKALCKKGAAELFKDTTPSAPFDEYPGSPFCDTLWDIELAAAAWRRRLGKQLPPLQHENERSLLSDSSKLAARAKEVEISLDLTTWGKCSA